jgi:hypothetical protein
MPHVLIWCLVFFGCYGGLSAAYHVYLTRYPRTVLVALDTSFPMHAVWSHVPETLATLQARRYTRFGLVTDKARVHTWQPRLDLGHVQPYAPRALAQMLDQQRYPELATAEQVYVVTNAAHSATLVQDPRWRLVQLAPLAP